MNRGGPEAARLWLQIEIAQAGAELRATARGCHGEEPAAHVLGPQVSSDVLLHFGEWVKEAAARGLPLKPPAQAQQLYQALFREGLQEVLLQLRGAAHGEPLLLRLNPGELALHAVPWEALCRPGTTLDFLGTSPELCIARGANSMKSFKAFRVEGAVRLLVISPSDPGAPERLRAALHPSIQAGELEWLTPLTGAHASMAYVLQRLRQQPVPHILHFIGHGGLDGGGNPTLRLGDKEGQESWLKVELLAKELEALFRGELRLVVLEACEGARPGTLPSAAALLTQAGAGAVVAHLWPVRADVARRCSGSFYRSLSGTAAHRGDVGRSLHDARRTLLAEFEESAEAFSPVLYLRGYDTTLFDFQGSKLPASSEAAPATPDSSLQPVARSVGTGAVAGTGSRVEPAGARWVTWSALAVVTTVVIAILAFWPEGTPEPSKPQAGSPIEQVKGEQAEEQSLAGLIRDEAGDPVANVEVALPKLGAKAMTDANGYFHLRARAEKQATVDLMARKDGYETYEAYATLGNTGLDFTLKKR